MKIQCPSCGKTYMVNDSSAGKQVKCGGCGQAFATVAAGAASPPPQYPSPPAQVAPPSRGGKAVAIASAAVGFILGVIVGGAGYALLVGPAKSQQPPAVAGQPSAPRESPPTAAQPDASGETAPETTTPEQPPNRLLKRDEIVTWCHKVDEELKILDVGSPGALRVLESNPHSVHVVRIESTCWARQFDSQEAQLLKDWVVGGGIMLADNDVFSLFNVGSATHNLMGGIVLCVPAIDSDLCPILAGVDQVQLVSVFQKNMELDSERVVPLLKLGGTSLDGTCAMSLVPYGKGWLCDMKRIYEEQYDGARFWLNFRMFCLGWDIPGAEMKTSEFRRQYAQPPARSAD